MAAVLLTVAGIWLFLQATAGRLPARMLSYREIRPGELPPPDPAGLGAGIAGAAAGAGASLGLAGAAAGAAGGWLRPTSGPMTSPFGPRNGRNHDGVDIAPPMGTPIVASRAGRVTFAGVMGGYGNAIDIDHGDGYQSRYAHQSRFAVGVGQTVAAGQTIGFVGSTGQSTGPHLHFEIRRGGTPIDPRTLVAI